MARFLLAIVAGAISGLLLALALPPGDQWWIGPICLAPVLAAVRGQGLFCGFLGGIMVPIATAAAIRSNLLYHIPIEDASPEWVNTGVGFFGFIIAVVCCVAGETKLVGWRRIALLGSLAVVLELALFPILPAHLALTQYQAGGMLLLASVGGIWLVSLLLWSANAAFAEALRRVTFRPAQLLGAALVGLYLLGLLPHSGNGPRTRVAAVQTDAVDVETLRKLNGEAGKRGALLSVWPEFSGLDMARAGDAKALRSLSAEPGQPAFVTSFPDGFRPLPHNTAALFANGNESARYSKRKLFGGEKNMHTAGSAAVAVAWNGHPSVGLNVCYDSCYPLMARETSGLPDVGLIALPTIDPESTNCFVAAIHAAFTSFRSAESGVPIVRADGNAYSVIVDNTGRIVSRLSEHRQGVLTGDVELTRRWTLYSVLGDWALYLCLIYVIAETVLTIAGRMKGKRKSTGLVQDLDA